MIAPIYQIILLTLLVFNSFCEASILPQFDLFFKNSQLIQTEKIKASFDRDGICTLSKSISSSIQNDSFQLPLLNILNNKDRSDLSAKMPEILKSFWNLRLHLRDEYSKLKFKNTEQKKACTVTLHQYLSYLRFTEESLILLLVKNKILPANANTYFSMKEPFKWKHSTFNNFMPGDILLSQGSNYAANFVSSVVIGTRSFSHLSMVVEDNQQLMIYEFLPSGVHKQTISEWLTDAGTRMAVYRFKDESLAQKAAQKTVQAVRNYETKYNSPFPYYFNEKNLDLSTNEPKGSIFCSGIVSWAFANTSLGKVIIPEQKSSYYSLIENIDIFKRLEIIDPTVFHPSDIEADTRFELIAESKAFKNIEPSHIKEAIFNLLANQLRNRSYVYNYNWKTFFKRYYAKARAYCCQSKWFDFSNYIPVDALESIVEMSEKVDYYYDKIEQKIKSHNLSDGALSLKQYENILAQITDS